MLSESQALVISISFVFVLSFAIVYTWVLLIRRLRK